MPTTTRKSYQRAIDLYEKAFGPKHLEHKYLVRPADSGIVVAVAHVTDTGVFVIINQALVHKRKVFCNNEIVYDGGSNV